GTGTLAVAGNVNLNFPFSTTLAAGSFTDAGNFIITGGGSPLILQARTGTIGTAANPVLLNVNGPVSATTIAAGTSGDVFIRSPGNGFDLNLASVTTAGGSSQTVNISTTGGGLLHVVPGGTFGTGDNITLDAGIGSISMEATTTGNASITFNADEI